LKFSPGRDISDYNSMAQSYPKFREDLIISQQEFEKVTYYVIKDPITQKFFRIKEFEYFITQNLDGKTSPEEIAEKFQKHFGIRLPLDTLNKFIHRLETLGFLEGEVSERELAKLQYRKKTLWGKLLFIKLKGFDPDRLLNRILKYTKFLFTPHFFVFSLFVIFGAIVITISNWGDLGYTVGGLFKVATIFKIWVAIFLVIVLHEFAHGLTCKYFGGEVHEMGFLLLYFQPCFFCNVSDAYLFKEKSKKLWVTFAGAYGQVFVWALATFLWRITALDTGLSSFLFVVILTSGVTVLFNFNPLIKLDGYYLLSDYLEIPNLRKKAFAFLASYFKRGFLKDRMVKVEASSRDKKIFIWYGVLSLLYSALLLFFIFIKVENFLVSHLGGFGFVLFLFLLFLILRQPVKKVLTGLYRFIWARKEDFMRPKKIITYSAIIIVLFLFLFLVKMELKVGSPCEICALESYTLRSFPDGTVTEELFQGGSEERKSINLLKLFSTDYAAINLVTKVKEGERIEKGMLVAELSSASYLSDLEQTKAALKRSQESYALLKKGPREESIQQAKDKVAQTQTELGLKEKELKRFSDLHEKNLISNQELEKAETEHSILSKELEIAKNELEILKNGARPEELKMAGAEIEELEAKANFLEAQVSASQIKSPIFGVVTSLSSEKNSSPSFGSLGLSIANLDSMWVLMKVSEKDWDALKEGQNVKLKVKSYPFSSFWGKVFKISQKAEKDQAKNVFRVTCKIENENLLLKPGMSGYAKIYCGKRNILNLLTRRIVSYLRVEVWSWW
jgi:putative peptide zinc metalloprotease protein